ncbi:hypothetical protein DVH24_005239 [Malus domestica]|uniref:Uncharacterized protein n=1 Tax=Malus domestica TaxID=3750 RepID=A0A498IGS6_MALDO|nr:hypothetical protein DVH24_005239 [Malus domestica]
MKMKMRWRLVLLLLLDGLAVQLLGKGRELLMIMIFLWHYDLLVAFKEMLSESMDKLVDPKPEIASELSKIDLSIKDQIKTLNIFFEKPQNERTFLSLDGAMKKAFVLMLLGQSNRN